ncbi:MAG: chromosome partitioning protein ParB [Proteobacteria bacterium]|nr:chromosome partitioning protein ParB [Pseudomonadota bacterium]
MDLLKTIILSATLVADVAAGSTRAGAAPTEWISLSNIRPGQMTIGVAEARIRAAGIETMNGEERRQYLEEHPISIALGPKGRIHLIDGHHLSYALIELESRGVMAAKAPAKTLGDLSESTESDFWKTMQKRNWVYLFDEKDAPVKPGDLPQQMKGLRDDRQRSLAWLLREEGCYKDLDRPFQEFAWAQFLRTLVPVPDNRAESFRSALLAAKKLAHEAAAADLPGYKKTHNQRVHGEISDKIERRISTL